MKDVVFALYDENGNEFLVKGAYLIADGGFHKMARLLDPSKTDYTIGCVRWSEFLESIRKDVEGFFWMLKNPLALLAVCHRNALMASQLGGI